MDLRNNISEDGHLALLILLMVIIALMVLFATTRLSDKLFVKSTSVAAAIIDPRFATAGPAATVLGNLYTYTWDQMSDPNPSDQPAPAPNHKFFWLVGKLDNRHDGLSCYPNCDLAAVNNIYAAEEGKIKTLLSKEINKSGVWFVGNEANATPRIDPIIYAQQFKKYKDLIKSLDSSSQVGHSGLVYFTTYSLGNNDPIPYLEAVLKTLPSPSDWPDIYNIHLYPDIGLPSQDVISVNQARDFRNYLNGKGESSNPIWVTEVGVNAPSKKFPNRAEMYMDTVINGLRDQNLAQRWFWFIGSSEPGYEATALTSSGQLTPLGAHYQQLMDPSITPTLTPTPMPPSNKKRKKASFRETFNQVWQ